MLVVADSSPVIALTEIGQLDVLPALFGKVIVPPQIAAELSETRRSQSAR